MVMPMLHCCSSGNVRTWMFEEFVTRLRYTWQWIADCSRLLAHSSGGMRVSMREIRTAGLHCTQPSVSDLGHLMINISTWCGIYWSMVRTWTPRPTPDSPPSGVVLRGLQGCTTVARPWRRYQCAGQEWSDPITW